MPIWHANCYIKLEMLPSVKTLDLLETDKRKDEDEGDESRSSTSKRQRTFASERNQFVVHVFVPLEDDEQIEDIYGDLADVTPKVHFDSAPHISLIRGHYAVQYHQIEPLLSHLASAIESYNQFTLCLSNVRLFNNDERSRYFIAICEAQVSSDTEEHPTGSGKTKNSDHLSKSSRRHDLIKSIHNVLKQYRSEVIKLENEQIESFTYHTSIAWFLPEDCQIGEQMVDQVRQHFADQVILTRVNAVHIKVGHRSKIVHLT